MKRDLARLLKQKRPALTRLFESNPCVLGVFLFGSQADGTATPDSDIDLAVLFDGDISPDEELTFEAELSRTLETDNFDVVNLNQTTPTFRFRSISGKLLYERDEIRVSDFIEKTLTEHDDHAWAIRQFNADFVEGMRQDYARFRHAPNRRTPKNHRKQPARARNPAW